MQDETARMFANRVMDYYRAYRKERGYTHDQAKDKVLSKIRGVAPDAPASTVAQAAAMNPLACVLCHFAVLADDVAVAGARGCVCLRCYAREAGVEKPMPKALRQDLIDAMGTTR